jgi:hypothetical protein
MNQYNTDGSALLVLLFVSSILAIMMTSMNYMFWNMYNSAFEREKQIRIFYGTESLLLYGKKIYESTDKKEIEMQKKEIFQGTWPLFGNNRFHGRVSIERTVSQQRLVAQLFQVHDGPLLYTLELML